jgi:Arc/MetJ-type ribon-helix-helix transcriptional regulator
MADTLQIPDDVARFLEAQVRAGRFATTADALRASVQALSQRDASDAEKTEQLRAAWDAGLRSLDEHGAQLETDAEFESFLDQCEDDTARQ